MHGKQCTHKEKQMCKDAKQQNLTEIKDMSLITGNGYAPREGATKNKKELESSTRRRWEGTDQRRSADGNLQPCGERQTLEDGRSTKEEGKKAQ